MSDAQLCPICGAGQPLSARTCSICGAVLPGERTPVAPSAPVAPAGGRAPRYDPAEGDDDLYVGDLSPRMWRLTLFGGVVLALVVGLGIGVAISQIGNDSGDDPTREESPAFDAAVEGLPAPETPTAAGPTAPPTATSRSASPTVPIGPTATMTSRAVLSIPTVTPVPPSPTLTPTPGPCYQTAQSGDTILEMAIRCGHRDMAVIDEILRINDMESASELQINQTLEIPWPTATSGAPSEADTGAEPDTEAMLDSSSAEGAAVASSQVVYNEFGTPDALQKYQDMEPTLRPGQAWHSVTSGETILSIAVQYDTDIETLSQINPEVPFLQCDYGMASGGPNCSVMLVEGQQLRVPVPLPTQTLTPTPSGSLTPTPTATATFNAPYLLSPENGQRFRSDEIVTLRWGGTGNLGPNECYLVSVQDQVNGQIYSVPVSDTSYILPGGWQPDDGDRHTFYWTITLVTVDDNNNVLSESFQTEPYMFDWESR